METLAIEYSHTTATGQRYSVTHNGGIVIKSSRNPECDGARYLRDAGYSGQFRTVHHGVISLTGDIAKCAEKTVAENNNHGPRLVNFVPFEAQHD